jgi:hypothetical protein
VTAENRRPATPASDPAPAPTTHAVSEPRKDANRRLVGGRTPAHERRSRPGCSIATALLRCRHRAPGATGNGDPEKVDDEVVLG